MHSALSNTTKGTPSSRRHAAVASPDGPAPMITGPLTQMLRLLSEKSSLPMSLNMFSILRGEFGRICGENQIRFMYFFQGVGEFGSELEQGFFVCLRNEMFWNVFGDGGGVGEFI